MKKIFKKVFKILFWFLSVIVVLLIALYFFIQTDTFNRMALDYTLKELNEGWEQNNSQINVRSLRGNILKGLVLDSGTITIQKDTLLNFDGIDLKYSIWNLLDHEINLDHVILYSPKINLIKLKDTNDSLIWNFAKLFSSSEEVDTSSSPFDWDIIVNTFKVVNGSFRTFGKYNDSIPLNKFQNDSINEFDFNNLLVSNLNLELKGDYFKDNKNLKLHYLTFNTNSGFSIKKFNFYAGINIKDTITELNGFEILTDRSHINLNKLFINSFNPFDSTTFENFKNKDFEADINIEKINFKDVRFFLPDVDMLDSTAGLSLNAKGKYGDFNLSDLTLRLPDSYINIKGNVQHLDDPEKLYLDVIADNMDLETKDIKTIYKDPSIPDLTNLGRIKANIEFTGTFEKFYSRFDINSGAGSAGGYVNLNTDDESYSGKINTSSLDLGKILNDKSFSSNLNLYSDFSGKGFEPSKMATSVKYSISRSSFSGYDIRSSGGTVNFVRNNINLNIKHISSMGNVIVKGRANIANMNNPVYALKGKVSNLNISKFTKNNEDNSNLNFSFDINGRGSSINNINGNFNFDFNNSFYAQHQIPQTPLNVEVRNSGNNSSVIVSSDIFDFSARGNFNIGVLSKVINYNIGMISEKFKNKLTPDSTGFNTDYASAYTFPVNDGDNFLIDYELFTKDTAKSNQLLNPLGIIYNGNIKGNIANDQSMFSLNAIVNIEDFVYQDTMIVLKNFDSDISLSNNYSLVSDNSLSSVEMKLKTTGDKVSFQNSIFDSVNVNVDLSNSLANININGKQDSILFAYVNGKVDLNGNQIKTNLDSVKAKYNNIEVSNEKDWIINYLPGQKINFEQFAVKSSDAVININGDFVMNGSSDLKIEGNEIQIADIYKMMNSMDTTKVIKPQPYPIKGSISQLLIIYKGDLENPEVKATINTSKLKYTDPDEDLDIGDISAQIDYKSEVAATDISLNNAEGKGSLKITGDIPYANPLSEKDTIASPDFSNKNVDLKLTSKDFQLKYFLKLIPSLPEISGIMNGEITSTGTAAAPELKGSVAINNGNFYLAMTGMDYKFKLNTSTENSKLVINNLTMSSVDDEARHFDIYGNIDFSGMKINDIDLNTSGDMVFLDKDVTENELGVYGYFRGGSGKPELKMKGNLDKLSITGQFLIKDATISSIPLGGSGYDGSADNFVYVSDSDTLNINSKDSLIILKVDDYKNVNPFERYKYKFIGDESSTADFLDIDINVKTEKNIYVSIDFDNITKDRLFGEVTADLNMKTEGNEFHATGDVEILKNSYYRFYKNFKLGNSRITFDGPITNPNLDIQAVHEGVKTTEQFGTVASVPVEIMLTLKGELDAPQIELKLIEDGTQVSGTDAQADAITFLLFGKYKSELSTSERTAVASSLGTSLGSLYISSIVSQTVRDVLPFLIDAQFKYSEGNVTDTDVELTSELGEATIKVGGKLLKEIRNFEFVIDYPLNNFLNLNLPETLMLEFSREEEDNIIFGSSETTTNTGIKIIYKIKY
ncbi:MAG: translocation/assembly module TamB [Bacteroidota bacterium]|nr:translocation/assembly module TamB [Bacteroidota bacterium]